MWEVQNIKEFTMKMVWWNIYLYGKKIDELPYDQSYTTPKEVVCSLVNHDGYPPEITVRKDYKKVEDFIDEMRC